MSISAPHDIPDLILAPYRRGAPLIDATLCDMLYAQRPAEEDLDDAEEFLRTL